MTAPIVISAGTESASAVQQQMGGGQNLYFDTFFNHSGRFYDAFLSQWQAAGNSPSLADDFAINGWLAVTMFRRYRPHAAHDHPGIGHARLQQAEQLQH